MRNPAPVPPPTVDPPVIGSVPPPLPPDRPMVVPLYRVWCGLFVLIYAGIALYSIQIARGAADPPLGLIESALAAEDTAAREALIAEKRAEVPELAAVTACVALYYGFAGLIPRRRWAWLLGLITICTTVLPFGITAAGTVPLLVHWAKPAAKRHFKWISPAR